MRPRERDGTNAGRVRPRAVAAAEQLGPLGERVRGGRLRAARARAGRTTPRRSSEAREHPEVFAGKTVGDVADHFDAVIGELDAQAGRSSATRSAACSPRSSPGAGLSAAIGRDRPGAVPRRPAAADLGAQVGVAGARAIRPTATARCRSPTTSSGTPSPTRSTRTRRRSCTRRTPCRPPGKPLFQAATANFNPWTEVKVDTKNPERGPLLIISGEKDHTVPWSIANASYKQAEAQRRRHRDRRDQGPRPLAHDRQRLARGRGDRADVRPAVRRGLT